MPSRVYSGITVSRRQEAALGWVWRLMCVLLALGRLRQEDCYEFKINLDYTLRLSQKDKVLCFGFQT